ncbi:hypothetical protein TNCV_2315311 [Trichonephila clavipes]|nr:hypothetical protein TNCV_2315311 [Trichonephila clavipes]
MSKRKCLSIKEKNLLLREVDKGVEKLFLQFLLTFFIVHDGLSSSDDESDLRVTPFLGSDSWSLHGQFPVAQSVSTAVDPRPAHRVLLRTLLFPTSKFYQDMGLRTVLQYGCPKENAYSKKEREREEKTVSHEEEKAMHTTHAFLHITPMVSKCKMFRRHS